MREDTDQIRIEGDPEEATDVAIPERVKPHLNPKGRWENNPLDQSIQTRVVSPIVFPSFFLCIKITTGKEKVLRKDGVYEKGKGRA